MNLKIEILDSSHDRTAFKCEHASLENYIRTQVSQDVKKNLSACYVLTGVEDNKIKGYFTLSSGSVGRDEFPAELVKKVPNSYGQLPMALIGRLAVDEGEKGKRYGELLLVHALNLCADISDSLGTMAVVVDPIDARAASFYAKYGFIQLPSHGRMFIPIKTIKASRV